MTTVLFYIRLLYFSIRLLTEYFRFALKQLKAEFGSFVSFYYILLLFYYCQFNNCEDFFVVFTNISYSGVENRDISLVSKM